MQIVIIFISEIIGTATAASSKVCNIQWTCRFWYISKISLPYSWLRTLENMDIDINVYPCSTNFYFRCTYATAPPMPPEPSNGMDQAISNNGTKSLICTSRYVKENIPLK